MLAEENLSQLRKGVAEFCVLGALSEGQKYGLELSNDLVERGLIASAGTLYPLLSRMAAKGVVRSALIENPLGPSRRYYEITERGEGQLNDFRKYWPEFSNLVTEVTSGTLEPRGGQVASIFSRIRRLP